MNNTPPRSIHETIVERFESAWLRGEPEPIERVILDRSDPCYLATLEELVHLELEFTWKTRAKAASNSAGAVAGSIPGPRKIEHYFARFPELNVPDIALRLVRQEYLVRCRFGDQPSQQEYRQRFPEIVSGDEAAFRQPGNSQQNTLSTENELEPGQEIGRYVLIDEAGRGGFGRVWQVEDRKLGRRIALKQMSDRVAREDDLRRRFITEARISASLEHPGVVPVYDLDQLDEQHPYYTMKLVKGETLGEAISRFHTDSCIPPASSRSLEFQKLLGVFVSICRTIEYAHAHNVIHRDLKPQNIILGKYGETIVLDWGLAKVFQPDEESAQPDMASVIVRDWGADQTQPGSVQGTPAYMSPEQADGHTALVSPRTDIYALGVILYQILTGVLPFEGDSAMEVLQRVREGDFSPPRSVKHVVPKPLEAACLKAMARQPEDRYRLVQDLREDIERYLADEAVSVYREPWFARFRRWARRHRTLVAGAIAATGVLLVSLVVGIILLADAAERERAIADRERAARMLAEQKEREANQARQEAVQERDRANENLATAVMAVNRFLDSASNDPRLLTHALSDFRRTGLNYASEFYEGFLEQVPEDADLLELQALAWARLGDIEADTRHEDKAETYYREAIDALGALVEAEPQVVKHRRNLARSQDLLGRAYLRCNELTKAAALLDQAYRLRQALVVEFSEEPEHEHDLAESLMSFIALATVQGDDDAVARYRERHIDVRKRLVEAVPSSEEYQYALASALNESGMAHLKRMLLSQAEADLSMALKIVRSLPPDDTQLVYRQTQLDVMYGCGVLYRKMRRLKESETILDESIQLCTNLATRCPDIPRFMLGLADMRIERGRVYFFAKRFEDAEKQFDEVIKDQAVFVDLFPSQTASYRTRTAAAAGLLGHVFAATDRWEEAEGSFRRGAEIWQGLVEESPDVASYHKGRSLYELEVGWLYFDKQRLDQAELHLRACVLIAGRYLERFPHDREERLRMADAYRGLARVHSARGDLDRARPAFGTALGIYRSLAEATPDERDLQDRIAFTLQSLWIVDQQSLRFTQANEAGLEAAGIWMQHLETSQTVQDSVKKVWTLVFLATEAFRSGDFKKADRWLEIVIGEEEDLLASPDRNRVVRDGVARAHSIRAKILAQNGNLTEAIRVWEAGLAFVKGRHLDLHVAERPVLRALSGAYEAAAAEAREKLLQYSNEPAALVLGARVFAQAGKMAARDTALPENKRSETAEAYFLEAIQTLEDSRRSGAFETPVVRALLGAPDLDPLRARDDFQALLRVISPSGEFPEDAVTPDTTGP